MPEDPKGGGSGFAFEGLTLANAGGTGVLEEAFQEALAEASIALLEPDRYESPGGKTTATVVVEVKLVVTEDKGVLHRAAYVRAYSKLPHRKGQGQSVFVKDGTVLVAPNREQKVLPLRAVTEESP